MNPQPPPWSRLWLPLCPPDAHSPAPPQPGRSSQLGWLTPELAGPLPRASPALTCLAGPPGQQQSPGQCRPDGVSQPPAGRGLTSWLPARLVTALELTRNPTSRGGPAMRREHGSSWGGDRERLQGRGGERDPTWASPHPACGASRLEAVRRPRERRPAEARLPSATRGLSGV